MKINLIPIASSFDSVILVDGETVTIDGVAVDLSVIEDGEQCEAERPIVGLVRRVDGVAELSIEYHYSTETAEPIQSTDPAAYVVDVEAGQVPDPIIRKPAQEPIEDAEFTE